MSEPRAGGSGPSPGRQERPPTGEPPRLPAGAPGLEAPAGSAGCRDPLFPLPQLQRPGPLRGSQRRRRAEERRITILVNDAVAALNWCDGARGSPSAPATPSQRQ
eukprot:2606351-Lingulodinium_polyedra.AAC.1